jgi:hypothetical protein
MIAMLTATLAPLIILSMPAAEKRLENRCTSATSRAISMAYPATKPGGFVRWELVSVKYIWREGKAFAASGEVTFPEDVEKDVRVTRSFQCIIPKGGHPRVTLGGIVKPALSPHAR